MGSSVERFQDSQWQKLEWLNFSKTMVLSLVKEGTVLDVGCGDGMVLEFLTEKGLKCVGLDISGKAISICKERGLDCRQTDITEVLPVEDDSFDTVLLIDVLEHLFQPIEVLKEVHRVTRKDILISVPNFVSLPARLQILFGGVPENNTPRDGHVYWMTQGVITRLLQDSGFVVDNLRVNTVWENIPILGFIMKILARLRPSLFGLSFIVCAHKI